MKRSNNELLVLVCFFSLFSACSVFSKDLAPGGSGMSGIPLSPGSVSDIDRTKDDYTICPFDLLEISVFQEPDFNKTVRVSQDGFISFPLIGKVKVVGMDIIAAEGSIAELLEKDYLVSPSVNILVKEYSAKKVLVLGEVKNPGSYAIPHNKELTVIEAIALAGGFSVLAKIDNTKVIRIENGMKKYINVKVSDITQRGDKSKDIPLRPNDIVFVSERIF